MRRRRRRIGLALAVVACGLVVGTTAAGIAPSPSWGAVVVTTTSSTDVQPTTTVPPTVPPTEPSTEVTTLPTTSTVPERTSTTAPTSSSTTTESSTTTTTTPGTAKTSSSSSTPWGLILIILALVIAIVLVVLLLQRRKQGAALTKWQETTRPAVRDAQIARDNVLSGNALSADAELRTSVSLQVDKASRVLESAAAQAPDPELADVSRAVATNLRGLAFAIEAERLLRQGAVPPTGEQLAQADEARRSRTAELNQSLAQVTARLSQGTPAHRAR